MSAILARGSLTDDMLLYLTTQLADKDILVGDGHAPADGGWTGGQPGEGSFQPYVVLATGPAQKQSRDPLATDDTSWLATYTVKSVGALRSQTDWTADQARKVLADFRFKHINLDGDWAIRQTTFPRLGGVDRNDATDPPTWEQVDQVSVWLEAHLT